MSQSVISHIELRQFRNHLHYSGDFSPSTTVITGKNGSGKTSILEAVYVMLRGTSFRGSDRDIVQQGHEAYKIVGIINGRQRSVRYDANDKKTFDVNGKTWRRLPAREKYPVILFEPDDMRVIYGSPQRRRQYIDRLIASYNPEYERDVRRYERTLKQRNNVLKNGTASPKELFPWDVSLSDYGARIITARHEAIAWLNKDLSQRYREIAQDKSDVVLRYSYENQGDMATAALYKSLVASLPVDRMTGTTSVGPHRHDIAIELNGSSAATSASRGEMRSIMLACKLEEFHIVREQTGKGPVVLLDDVLSELDDERQRYFFDNLTSPIQTVITSAVIPEIVQDRAASSTIITL